jgi:hypothetical protein
MLKFSLHDFSVQLLHLRERLRSLREWSSSRGASSLIPEAERRWVRDTLQLLQVASERIELRGTVQRIGEIKYRLEGVTTGCTYQVIIAALEDLDTTMISDLRSQSFAYIPSARSGYFEQDALFGEQVRVALPDAGADIKSAGNCFVADEHTATVFHLIRAAEHGLRALARKLRVRLTHSGRLQPIEFADWDKVITACKNKIDAARKLSSGPRKLEKLALYADAADHCLYMKDIWRNNVSHTRKPYIESEAQVVMDRVRDFMTFLADRVLQ